MGTVLIFVLGFVGTMVSNEGVRMRQTLDKLNTTLVSIQIRNAVTQSEIEAIQQSLAEIIQSSKNKEYRLRKLEKK